MERIGEGSTAVVYSDGKSAYKVYHEGVPKEFMHYEVKVQDEVSRKTDLNVCDYETLDNKIKMTLIDGVLFADRIRVEKYKHWLHDFTDLQIKVYQYKGLELTNAFDAFKGQIESSDLDDEYKQKALHSLHKIDQTYVLCHLDFHPLNIMYSHNQYYIIDWINAKLGSPVMDIANTYIIFRQYLKRQANRYLNTMCQKTKYTRNDIIDALPLMAFVKLIDHVEKQHEELMLGLINQTDKIFD